jgi:hypothetical protein
VPAFGCGLDTMPEKVCDARGMKFLERWKKVGRVKKIPKRPKQTFLRKVFLFQNAE